MESESDRATNGPGHSLLLVDDDVELCALMVTFFSQHGFQAESVYDGRRGLARALKGGFDLILLDVMLPGLSGFDVLHQLRRRSDVPVIMLTARTEPSDRVKGLDTGADDYLPKPFGPEELLARIRAVLRRTTHSGRPRPETLDIGGIRLDSATRHVWRGTTRLELTSIEFEILNLLMRSAGRIVSRDEMATVLYQREATPYERSIDVHVSHLRKKLEHPGPSVIRTVRGVGYLFCADAEQKS
jgi:two-component system response regulator CpxR